MTSSVYFIEDVGRDKVKIGYTTQSVNIRMSLIKSFAPQPKPILKVLACIDGDIYLERRLHQAFDKYRIDQFSEWFQYSDEIENFISWLNAGYDVEWLLQYYPPFTKVFKVHVVNEMTVHLSVDKRAWDALKVKDGDVVDVDFRVVHRAKIKA